MLQLKHVVMFIIQTIYMSEEKAGTCAGTWHWMAPEMFKSKPSTTKSDVW